MSAWRMCVQAVAAAGGGPITEHDLLMRGYELGAASWAGQAMRQAEVLGFLAGDRSGPTHSRIAWSITPLGWELHQGRVERRCLRRCVASDGRPARTQLDTVATWLRALPAGNSIRLSAGDGVTR